MMKRILLITIFLLQATIAKAEYINASDVYVVDGDTIKYGGLSYRLLGFDTPETYRPRCDYEKALGHAATNALRTMVQSGNTIDLRVNPGKDKYNRGLAYLFIGNQDVGKILISERMARPYNGGRRKSWCH